MSFKELLRQSNDIHRKAREQSGEVLSEGPILFLTDNSQVMRAWPGEDE